MSSSRPGLLALLLIVLFGPGARVWAGEATPAATHDAPAPVMADEHASAAEKLTVDKAVELALRRDERVRSAAVRQEIAARLGAKANALYFPKLSGSGSILFQPESQFNVDGMLVTVQPSPQYQFGGQLTQPLLVPEFWGRKDVGKTSEVRAEADHQWVRAQVAVETIVAFYEVLKATWKGRLAQTAIDRADAQVKLATIRQEAGAALKTAVLQAEIDRDRFVRQKVEAEGAERVSREVLARLCGTPDNIELIEEPANRPVATVDAAIKNATALRPDVRAADRGVEVAEAELDAARAKLYPSLVGEAAYQHTEPPTIFNPRTDYWRALVSLRVPLYERADWLEIADRHNQIALAQFSRDLLRKQVKSDVVRAHAALETALKQLEVAERQRARADENHKLVVVQFRGGTANSTDVTLAQVTLAEMELQLAWSKYDAAGAEANYRFASGFLVVPSAATAAEKNPQIDRP